MSPRQVWPAADASLTVPCRTPRPTVGEHPRAYKFRLVAALTACRARNDGWAARDAALKALFTETPDGDKDD